MSEVNITNKCLEIMSDDAWTGIPIVKTLSREVLRLRKVNDKAFESAAVFAESIELGFQSSYNEGIVQRIQYEIAKGIRDLKEED